MKDGNSKSKGFCFVNFDSPDEAKKAMEATKGMQIGSKVLYVGKAQKKAEREKILHDQFERRKELQKIKVSNVYVKNIDDSVNDDELSSIFSKCGTITSAMIMLDEKGITKGFGFVCFTTIETSYQVVNDLHGIFLEISPSGEISSKSSVLHPGENYERHPRNAPETSQKCTG